MKSAQTDPRRLRRPPAALGERALPAGWTAEPNENAVFGRAQSGADSGDIKYLGTLASFDACVAAAEAANATKGPFSSLTW